MAMMAGMLPSLLGGLATTLFSSLMKDDAPAPAAAAPAVEAPTPMPTPNDQEHKAAQRRSMAQQRARQGRASTVLTSEPEAKLGG